VWSVFYAAVLRKVGDGRGNMGWTQQRLEEADSYGKLSIMRVRCDKIGTRTRVATMPDAYEHAKTMLESDVDELRSRSRVDGRG
jgi:hypothetical protein